MYWAQLFDGEQVELALLLAERKGTFNESYKPGIKLIELGLVEASKSKFGICSWPINAAGEAFLSSRNA